MLTWDSPDTRGSWADHGIQGIYLGPAMRHFRGFNIWVHQNSAQRVSGTVWWFVKPFVPDGDLLSPDNNHILYSPSRDRQHPTDNGEDLLGRCFFEPNLGVCCITHLGPVLDPEDNATLHSLHYRCVETQAECFSSVEQIATWIQDGSLLLPPVDGSAHIPAAPVSYPTYSPIDKGSNRLQDNSDAEKIIRRPGESPFIAWTDYNGCCKPGEYDAELDAFVEINHARKIHHARTDNRETPDPQSSLAPALRRSQRKRKAPDFLKPKFHGKAYFAPTTVHLARKERVPTMWVYLEKERVSQPEIKIRRLMNMKNKSSTAAAYRTMYKKYHIAQRERRNKRIGWSDLFDPNSPVHLHAMMSEEHSDMFTRDMPKPNMPPIYPTGPLNLNPDGTAISYRKSHLGPNATQWAQADAEEFERLFKSGTLRPIFHCNIPVDKDATYINPVCSEKLQDDGALKLRTRATIGGDKVDYPYSTAAYTADLESIKILVNAMISDNAAFSTVDLEDFYLGTPLPHPEFIRIPTSFIPKKVIDGLLQTETVHT